MRIRKREFDAAIGDYTEATRACPERLAGLLRARFSVVPRRAIPTAPSRTSPRCSSRRSHLRRRVRIPRLCLLEDQEFDKAVADFTAVIRRAPQGACGRTKACASLQIRRGKLDEAVADYTEAIRLAPGHAKAHLGRGWAYANKGDPDDAIADYTTAIRLDTEARAAAYANRGAVYADKGELDNAIADYTDAARLDPADAKAYYWSRPGVR